MSLADASGVESSTVISDGFLSDVTDSPLLPPPDRGRLLLPDFPPELPGEVPLVESPPEEEAASGLASKNSCQDLSTEDGSLANRSYISSTSHWFCPNCETLLLTISWCLSGSVVGFTRQWIQARPSARAGLSDLT